VSVVVDASVLVAALIDEGPHGAWAEGVIASGPVNAPQLVYAETANVLRRLERAQKIAAGEANEAFNDLLRLQMDLFPFEPFAERIWQLRHNVTTYDAWYVAVAEALNMPFATLDDALVDSSGPKCKFLTYRTK
jgi:predicted nucleic acid-binding protein